MKDSALTLELTNKSVRARTVGSDNLDHRKHVIEIATYNFPTSILLNMANSLPIKYLGFDRERRALILMSSSMSSAASSFGAWTSSTVGVSAVFLAFTMLRFTPPLYQWKLFQS